MPSAGAVGNKGKADTSIEFVWGFVRVVDAVKSAAENTTVFKDAGTKGKNNEQCVCLFCNNKVSAQARRILYHVAGNKEAQTKICTGTRRENHELDEEYLRRCKGQVCNGYREAQENRGGEARA